MEGKVRRGLAASVLAVALALGIFGGPETPAAAQVQTLRWDIVHVFFSTPPQVTQGGEASAKANDDSRITLTGRGTFVPGSRGDVTGGGTWTIRDASANVTGSGTFTVTELLYWAAAPGRSAPPVVTRIVRDPADTRAGLALFRVRYSNGSEGTLVVSCRLPGSPTSMFEGVTASIGFVTYAKPEPDVPGVDGNRTLFSIVRE